MILCDTGIFVSAINRADNDHIQCAEILRSLHELPVTTWPCITEALYLLYARAGRPAQKILQDYVLRDAILLLDMNQADAKRACDLMKRYEDIPMDFADASLVVAAEKLNSTRILTLDRHFYAYRINGEMPFEVIPG